MTMLEELKHILQTRARVTLCLALANVAVFVFLSLQGNTTSAAFMLEHGACYAPYVAQGDYWRLFTSMFLHFGAVHLLYNMLCLLTLGDMLEKAIGPLRYGVIYLLGGLAGNLLSVFWGLRSGDYAVSAGASGAVFAVIGALLLVVLRRRRVNARVGNIKPERMAMMVALMIAQGFLEQGTDNLAHMGGCLAGFIIAFLVGAR